MQQHRMVQDPPRIKNAAADVGEGGYRVVRLSPSGRGTVEVSAAPMEREQAEALRKQLDLQRLLDEREAKGENFARRPEPPKVEWQSIHTGEVPVDELQAWSSSAIADRLRFPDDDASLDVEERGQLARAETLELLDPEGQSLEHQLIRQLETAEHQELHREDPGAEPPEAGVRMREELERFAEKESERPLETPEEHAVRDALLVSQLSDEITEGVIEAIDAYDRASEHLDKALAAAREAAQAGQENTKREAIIQELDGIQETLRSELGALEGHETFQKVRSEMGSVTTGAGPGTLESLRKLAERSPQLEGRLEALAQAAREKQDAHQRFAEAVSAVQFAARGQRGALEHLIDQIESPKHAGRIDYRRFGVLDERNQLVWKHPPIQRLPTFVKDELARRVHAQAAAPAVLGEAHRFARERGSSDAARARAKSFLERLDLRALPAVLGKGQREQLKKALEVATKLAPIAGKAAIAAFVATAAHKVHKRLSPAAYEI